MGTMLVKPINLRMLSSGTIFPVSTIPEIVGYWPIHCQSTQNNIRSIAGSDDKGIFFQMQQIVAQLHGSTLKLPISLFKKISPKHYF
jgi:hypothetical protein